MNGKMVAGIDVHKRMLMVVVTGEDSGPDGGVVFERHRFGATCQETMSLAAWLQHKGVTEVVMESTAQYWKPVWLALEPHFQLFLAQAWSNRAPRGKKADFKDAERLVRRHLAGELTMSFVPDAEQRLMRSLTRRRRQLTRARVRTQSQVESLMEETRIKLSSVVSDLFGQTGLRILTALVAGESDAEKLAGLADPRVQCPREELKAALTGTVSEVHRKLLGQHLNQLSLADAQLTELEELTAVALRQQHAAIARLVKIPGIRVITAQQIVAEAGAGAEAFESAAQFSSWIGVCPGREESAGENRSSRTPKGNMYLRAVLSQAAQAAVNTKNSFFQQKFQRLVVRLGYAKAIWAIARHLAVVIWKVLHEGVEYIEYGSPSTPQAIKRRLQRVNKELRALRALGISEDLLLLTPQPRPV